MPDDYLRLLVTASKGKIALLDTNLLILQVSAQAGPNILSSFKRLRYDFDEQDLSLLRSLLSSFIAFRANAYVLAEASNLANGLKGQMRTAWFQELAKFTLSTEEKHVETKIVGSQFEVVPFGVTDAALSYLSQNHTVITTDGGLYAHLERLGRNVINFHHLRTR